MSYLSRPNPSGSKFRWHPEQDVPGARRSAAATSVLQVPFGSRGRWLVALGGGGGISEQLKRAWKNFPRKIWLCSSSPWALTDNIEACEKIPRRGEAP